MRRGQLPEFGIVLARWPLVYATQFAKRVLDGECPDLPEVAGGVVTELCEQLIFLRLARLLRFNTREMTRVAQREELVAMLQVIPGVGPITASASVATAGITSLFSTGREVVAWLGLTRLNRSSGRTERLWRISKMGDQGPSRGYWLFGMTFRMRQIIAKPRAL